MGRTAGYTYLLKRIKALWHPESHIDMVAIAGDYFLVKFLSLDNYNHAKYEGPWMILDHYLIVNEWYHDFDPAMDKTEKMIIWIHFPTLPIEYYNTDFMLKNGEKIGRPVKVDQATSFTSRGMFA